MTELSRLQGTHKLQMLANDGIADTVVSTYRKEPRKAFT
ncbi:hypothetical protein SNOG_06558 [Parastagonospora nodorum SN15]|uniref:Uncharacterized protein n=1 Tax=Phaeosphaeria nodorum (strain SN15 / ATCC MYA-4574 / FGSC 10173) TaxID=321614 RepID=Q0UNV6_PHANO|nr:hypothetical protein SNOG_06558 [Parastagonospora nodorum SN15]EAT86389.1 hypothetical protein SNOG_06558 [Parastagonospora nodorum SN15]